MKVRWQSIVALVFFFVLFITFTSPHKAEAGQGKSVDLQKIKWELNISFDENLSTESLVSQLSQENVIINNNIDISRQDGGIQLAGSTDFDQLGFTLFDSLENTTGFLGDDAQIIIHLPSSGNQLVMNLETRFTSGYYWKLVGVDGVEFTQINDLTFNAISELEGAPSIETILLQPSSSGRSTITFENRQWFSPKPAVKYKLEIWIDNPIDQIDIVDPTPEIVEIPSIEETLLTKTSEPLSINVDALPSSFDWRDYGVVPVIRPTQGGCGSCWAFGTVGVMESALKIAGEPFVDLSEQFLVSCNRDGYDCNGGLTAHQYHYDKLGKSQTEIGAVLETDMPYTATNGTCTVAYDHPYKLKKYNTTDSTTTALKTAIYVYGPITVRMCADQAFADYTGGVFETDEACTGSNYHRVILVGWNDETGSWILRNSWGAAWGESGYMRIKYGTSTVGKKASWVAYSKKPNAPSGTVHTFTPTFEWNQVVNATKYKIQVYKGLTLIYTKLVDNSICDGAICEYTPGDKLRNKDYKWHLKAYRNGVWLPWSPYVNFKVDAGFTSNFNGTMAGWEAKGVVPWNVNLSEMYTKGRLDYWSNVYYKKSEYADFEYSARVKRTNDISSANYITVRMGTNLSSEFSNNTWYPGYVFGYTNYGKYSIWILNPDESETLIQPWTNTDAIVPNDWNVLKVKAVGSTLNFYINDTLIHTFTDPSFSSGYVGFVTFKSEDIRSLFKVDWAKLTYLSAASLSVDTIDPEQEALNQAAREAGENVSIEGYFGE